MYRAMIPKLIVIRDEKKIIAPRIDAQPATRDPSKNMKTIYKKNRNEKINPINPT